MNIPKLLKACDRARLWDESVFLYKEDEQQDSAVKLMIDHPTAFKHELFLDCCQKVRNTEIYYASITFYLQMQPMKLDRLLQVLTPNLDHARVVHLLRKSENLPLAMPYLKNVQKENLTAVNEALNELYIEEEDYQNVRTSIDEYDNFDQIYLAQKTEKHELLEFRRIAAYLYKRNKRYGQSIELSKGDKMFKDAIDTAAESESAELVEALLRYFVEQTDKECFCATLYTCYDLVLPDVALELAWRNKMVDFVMPYIVQYTRHLHDKIKALEDRTAPPEVEEDHAATAAAAMMYTDQNLMLTDGSYNVGVPPGMPYGGAPQMAPQMMGGMNMPPQPQMGMPGMGSPSMAPMPQMGMPQQGMMPQMGQMGMQQGMGSF